MISAPTQGDAVAFDPSDPGVALAGLVALGVGVLMLPLTRLVGRWLFPWRARVRRTWSIVDVVAVAATFFAAQLSLALLLGLAGYSSEDPPGPILTLLATAAGQGAAVAVAVLAALRHPGEGWRSLGLGGEHLPRATAFGVSQYVLSFPLLIGAMLAWPWLLEALGGEYGTQDVAVLLASAEGWRRWLLPVFSVALVPLLEEVLFRGFLQTYLVARIGAAAGIVLTSVLFALLHGWAVFVPIFALSCVLGVVMHRTGRVAAAWSVHAVHNGIVTLLLFVSSDLILDEGALVLLPT